MTSTIDQYLHEGCGRCPLGGTPECKVLQWVPILTLLRQFVLDCGLTEEVKWGVPCYTFQQKNVLLLSAFKKYCAISFFKGSLLSDIHHMLEKPGKHSQAARLLKFTRIEEIKQHKSHIKAYLYEAMEIEKAGLRVQFEKNPEPMPEELEQKLTEDPLLKAAFEALTPGRQRGYILYFSAPKQAKTRIRRIEKSMDNILHGVGLHDNYSSNKNKP